MYICVCVCVYTHTHTHTYIYIYTSNTRKSELSNTRLLLWQMCASPLKLRSAMNDVGLRKVFLRFPVVSIIPPTLHKRFHLYSTFIRRTIGRSLANLQLGNVLPQIGMILKVKYRGSFWGIKPSLRINSSHSCNIYPLWGIKHVLNI